MVSRQENLDMDYFVSIPQTFEWMNRAANSRDEITRVIDLSSKFSKTDKIDENSIIIEKSPVVIGYLFFAIFYFFFGIIAGGLFLWFVK